MSKGPTPKFRNFYRCPECKTEWQDEWDSTCNDECPNCGLSDIEPYKSEDIPPQKPDTEGEAILKAIATKATEDHGTRLYEEITKAARQHGEDSEPDHEVGDLQQALQQSLEVMTPEQLEILCKNLRDQDLLPQD